MKVFGLFSFHELVSLHATEADCEVARVAQIDRERAAVLRYAEAGASTTDIEREFQMIEDDYRVVELEVKC